MAGPKNDGYLRQLDGLRALSVAAVAWSHWRAYWFRDSSVPWAEFGVETFFVISGFLITGILLDNRSESSKPLVLRQFYARRFLRIFPLFYATLLIGLVLRADSMGQTWYWHAGYLSNFYFYLWGWCGQLSHFWSLAVEEQFYLFWPLLMIFLPKRFLLPAILAGIGFAPVFETAMDSLYPWHSVQVSASVLMPSCMDALGMGALLAYGIRNKFRMQRLAWMLLLAGIAGYALCHHFDAFKPAGRLAEDCVLGWLVYSAAAGFRGPFGWFLGCPPMNYLGKISYGLYVIHNFAVSICTFLIFRFGSPDWVVRLYNIPVVRILAFTGVTVGLAAYSWHRFEKPINNLKRKFPYPGKVATSSPGS
jgi:peptidoglycan/LPS O-acetylase OafA/YrhL